MATEKLILEKQSMHDKEEILLNDDLEVTFRNSLAEKLGSLLMKKKPTLQLQLPVKLGNSGFRWASFRSVVFSA
jgi:hypothetical protein